MMAMEGRDEPVSNTLWRRYGKRGFDVFAAAALLIILSPLLLITAVLVKATSKGPVFFIQKRGGRDGKPFLLIKFRTMRGYRTPDPKELVPLDHADITRIGRIMRRCKIDELPQLLNVLVGSMSLIGPRPTLLDQVAAYDRFRRQRLLVRPGITGLAQVHGNAMTAWDHRILYDIAYVRCCSLWLDVRILARTILTLMRGEEKTTQPFQESRYARFVTPPEDYPTEPYEQRAKVPRDDLERWGTR